MSKFRRKYHMKLCYQVHERYQYNNVIWGDIKKKLQFPAFCLLFVCLFFCWARSVTQGVA